MQKMDTSPPSLYENGFLTTSSFSLRLASAGSVSVRGVPAMVERNTILVRLILTRIETRSAREFLHHGLRTGATCKVSVTANSCEIGRPGSEIMIRNWAEACYASASVPLPVAGVE